MKKFRVKITPEAISDIQEITNWYNEQHAGIGRRFLKTIIRQINSLSKIPHSFAIRYHEIRCMPVKKFPYMVHFHIDEDLEVVEILAIISTDRNPYYWKVRMGKNPP